MSKKPDSDLIDLAQAISHLENDEVVIGFDARIKDWRILPLEDPECFYLEHQKFIC